MPAKDISNSDFSLRLVRIFLLASAVKLENVPRPYRYANHYALIVASNAIVVVTQTMLLYRVRDVHVIGVILNNLIHCSNYIITWILIYRKRATLRLILETVTRGVYRYPAWMRVHAIKQRTKSVTLALVYYTSYTSFLLILMAPMVYATVNAMTGEHATPTAANLIYPAWYPWDIRSRTAYYLTCVAQLGMATVTAGYMPFNISFVLYFVLVIRDQTRLLIAVTRSVVTHDRNATTDGNASAAPTTARLRDEAAQTRRLKLSIMECVEHHRSIIRFINYFVSIYKWIFTLNLVYSTAVFTLNCYLLVSSDYYLPKFTQRICELLLVFPYLFVYCYIGEIFKDVNKVFQRTIYDINWYEKPIKVRKSILFLLTTTSKEITLKFSANLVASYALFSSILRASYTYANILLKTSK